MPGDKVEIGEDHIAKANTVIKALVPMMAEQAKAEGKKKIVIAVCGGSGVGKSETASLLSYYFNQNGIGSYTMSGDNYPRRIPMYNDAERLRIYRYEGLQQMLKENIEKTNAKRAKKGLPPINEQAAEQNLKKMQEKQARLDSIREEKAAASKEKMAKADEYYELTSIADRAKMVQQFEQKKKK